MRPRRYSAYQISIHLLLVVLALAVLGLVRRNGELRAPAGAQGLLEAGETVRPFVARELDGSSRLVSFEESERETLLFVFTTVCPACRDNQPRWSALYEQVRSDYDVIGVSLNELEVTRRYRETHDLPFDVVVPEDIRGFVTDNNLFKVPVTVHVDREKKVVGTWLGILAEESLAGLMNPAAVHG